ALRRPAELRDTQRRVAPRGDDHVVVAAQRGVERPAVVRVVVGLAEAGQRVRLQRVVGHGGRQVVALVVRADAVHVVEQARVDQVAQVAKVVDGQDAVVDTRRVQPAADHDDAGVGGADGAGGGDEQLYI